EGRSDGQGHFSLDCPADLTDPYRQRHTDPAHGEFSLMTANNTNFPNADQGVTLWAYRAGMQAAVREIAGSLPSSNQPIQLVLAQPAGLKIHVKDSGLHPVPNARIRVSRLIGDLRAIPRPLAEHTELSTDESGEVILDALAAERIAEVEVEAKGFGLQRCSLL